MTKFLIGVATAALWFALSHAANANGYAAKSATTAPAYRAASSVQTQMWSFASASTGGITTAALM